MKIFHAISAVQRAGARIVASNPLRARCRCSICKRQVQRFLPYRGGWANVPPLIRQLNVVGSDVENFECPVCGCHDRERHLLMYLRASGLLPRMHRAKVLHLAPEHHLQKYIRATEPIEYVLGDLWPSKPQIQQIDLQAIRYPDNYFDFVLANHVLEHVEDDMRALREIYRVLRFEGHAILQTPYSEVLTRGFEDAGIQSDPARLHAYGQEDHQRLYGRNIVEYFESAGLRSLVKTHAQLLPDTDPNRFGVNSGEPFFLFKKNPNMETTVFEKNRGATKIQSIS